MRRRSGVGACGGLVVGGQLRLGGKTLGTDDRADALGRLGATPALALRVEFLERGQRAVDVGDVLFEPLESLGCQAFAHADQGTGTGRPRLHG